MAEGNLVQQLLSMVCINLNNRVNSCLLQIYLCIWLKAYGRYVTKKIIKDRAPIFNAQSPYDMEILHLVQQGHLCRTGSKFVRV